MELLTDKISRQGRKNSYRHVDIGQENDERHECEVSPDPLRVATESGYATLIPATGMISGCSS